MKKNMSASLSDFVDNIYTLKALTRYNNKFKIISESVAEHSFFVAVLVLKMHDDYKFNLEKALKMGLIHDVPELHLSDVTHDVKRNFPKLAKEVTNAEYVIMRDKYPNWYESFKEFEDQFCKYVGAKYGCGVNSATNAIFLSLLPPVYTLWWI